MAKELHSQLIQDIEEACSKINIRDRFDVATISGRSRAGVDELISEVFRLYERDCSKL
jgi:hypothetical protein